MPSTVRTYRETSLSELEIRELSRGSAWHSILALTSDWLLIVGAFFIVIKFPHPFSYAATFLLIASQQLALAILMHDAAHKRLFKSVRINDAVGQYLCAAPLLFSMYSYRKLHLKHHQAPLAEDDPEMSLIGGYPISKSSFARKLARDAFGISYFKFIRYFIHMSRKTNKSNSPVIGAKTRVRESAPTVEIVTSIIVSNALILLALTAAHHPWCYVSLWLLPAITALQVLLRIRGIAEHSASQPLESSFHDE